ncbi:MAG TPA: serine/threonine-protein kinase [Candidatus Obscuribacterales bacterium]
MANQPGTELKRSKYRLLGLVGQGQFGRVFCAAHRRTGRLVALKNLEQQRFPTHKFLRELRFLLSLQHDNIVTCQALEHTATGRYVVMDYCEGGTMRGVMNDDYRLNLFEGLSLINDVLAGLEHAHLRGIVHCDIKPENILLNLRMGGWRARISDFGISKLSQELRSDEETGNTGSPAYMAPERFYGQYSASSDLYSVGVMLYELLTGDRPFQGTPSELMSAHLNTPLQIPDSVPTACRSILATSLQKLAARRFRTAGEMRQALQEAIALLQEEAARTTTVKPLLQFVGETSVSGFSYEQAILLKAPVYCLEHDAEVPIDLQLLAPPPQRICQQVGQSVKWTVVAANASQESEEWLEWRKLQMPEMPRQLWLRPQGCFVATERSLSLLPILDVSHGHEPQVQSILSMDQPFWADVESGGRWIAIATNATYRQQQSNSGSASPVSPDKLGEPDINCAMESTLQFVRSPLSGDLSLPDQPIRLFKPGRCYNVQQLIALDSRHVAVVAQREPESDTSTTPKGTLIEIFNRRGHVLGSLAMPVLMGQAIKTPTPYRLLAPDAYNPHALLMLDLKPYRINRIGVEIQPYLLAATTWGYVVVDQEGQILLLTGFGDRIERINGPKSPTAIAMPNPHTLLLATWNQSHGSLYRVNLKQLDIDLLF